MKRFRMDRRTLLRGLGAAIALPTLDAMLDSRGQLLGSAARAATTPFPKRLVTFYFPHGVNHDTWTPTTTGNNFALPESLAPLAPVRSNVVVLSGLTNTAIYQGGAYPASGHHARFHSFSSGMSTSTAGAGGPTIEQVAAKQFPNVTKLSSLVVNNEQAINSDDGATTAHMNNISWSDAGVPVTPYRSTQELFNKLFASVPTSTGASDAYQNKISVLDRVKKDIDALAPRLGSVDRARLDLHLTSIREIERELKAPGPVCVAPSAPGNITVMSARAKTFLSLIALALKCDLTRYVSFSLSNGFHFSAHPDLAISQEHHGYGHDGNMDGVTKIVAYEVALFVHLLTELQPKMGEADNVLANSLVYFGTELSTPTHDNRDMPILLGGGAGGALVGNRHLRYTGQSHCRLLVSLLNLTDVPVTRFGHDGEGPLPNLV